MKTYTLITFAVVSLLFASCADWLDVSPKTQVKSDELFSDEEGFKSALTGIYKYMGKTELYGAEMTFGFMEKLVQRYDNYTSTTPTDIERAAIYDYKNNSWSKEKLALIWQHQFTVIANINNLLENLETKGSVVRPSYIPIMKGEALGLRAFIYLDLLRMWGPVYSQNPQFKSLPWRDKLTSDKLPLLEADKIAGYIIADLKQAEQLLAGEPATIADVTDDAFLSYRQHRMNRFAVKALLARTYLWIGDTQNAYRYADEVIRTSGLSLAVDNRLDPSMFKEHVFSLYIYKMESLLRDIFPPTADRLNESSDASTVLWISDRVGEEVFESRTIGINDIRYKNRQGFLFGNNRMLLRKFMTIPEANTVDKMPLVRLAEMYLIRAETGTLNSSAADINKLRNVRGIRKAADIVADENYTEKARIEALNKEYRKEFFGEGQWFFFLKRHNMDTFYRYPNIETGMDSHYLFPIPDDEVEHGLGGRE